MVNHTPGWPWRRLNSSWSQESLSALTSNYKTRNNGKYCDKSTAQTHRLTHTHTHADKQKETLSRTVRDRDTDLGWEKQRKDEPLAVQIQNFIITKHVTGAISVQISVYLLATNSKTHEKGSRAERRLARYLTSFVSRCFNSAEWLH